MTIFDYLVLFVLGCSVLVSTLRGLVREILSLFGWVVAFWVANTYGNALAELLPEMTSVGVVRLIAAFLILFIGTRLLVSLLNMAITAGMKAGGWTVADRGLGSLFGLSRGMVLVLVGVLLCGMTSIPKQPFWRNALLSPLAETAARTVLPFLPKNMTQYIHF